MTDQRDPAQCSGRYTGPVVRPSPMLPEVRPSGRPSAPESLAPTRAENNASVVPERSRPAAAKAGGRRIDHAQLERLSRELTDRDTAILDSVARFSFLTTRQVQVMHFSDHATDTSAARICRRVLLRLRDVAVIEELDRRLGGVRGGSESYVWRVGKAGDRLLQLASGHGVRARRKEPSLHYLQHCLAIADAYLTLLTADRDGQLELLRTDTEPNSWRAYLGPAGERLMLKPDLFAVTASAEFESFWALEVDRGTESIPTLLRKCRQYEAYRRTGLEQRGDGVFPLVVWIVPSDRRAQRLEAAIASARNLDPDLYRICMPANLLAVILNGGAA